MISSAGNNIHPVVNEVTWNQLRILKIIYMVMIAVMIVLLGVTVWLSRPLDFSNFKVFSWIELALGFTGVILLGIVVPFSRSRLLSPVRLGEVGPEDFEKLGLPREIDQRVGRQALFLSRYTAGCVTIWGICEVVGLYGLMVGMMGAGAWITGLFFAAPAFVLALMPPSKKAILEGLSSIVP